MFTLLFGSYSMVLTTPGIPYLSRLKSMIRYARLWPPPLRRTLMRPKVSLPAFLLRPLVKDFSGLLAVSSLKTKVVFWRRPGVLGLYVLSAIFQLLLIRLRWPGWNHPWPRLRQPSSSYRCYQGCYHPYRGNT